MTSTERARESQGEPERARQSQGEKEREREKNNTDKGRERETVRE